MPDGYHVIGHYLLEYWTARAEHDENATVQRAARDIKLLAGLLDAEVGLNSFLLELINDQAREDTEP